jgi:hypothetical protein
MKLRRRLRCISCTALLIALGLMVRGAPPARASSINGCIDSCFGAFSGPNQTSLRDNCVNTCPNRVNFGAIAYSARDDAYGYSFDYHNAGDADQRALSDCQSEGEDCKVVLTFSETCAALAAGDNKRFAASIGDGAGDAANNALNACSHNGGKKCAIKLATCARD